MQKPEVVEKFNRMEKGKEKLYVQLENLNEKVLYLKPREGKWSVAQIIFHLNSSESRTVIYVSKKMLGGTTVPKSNLIAAIKTVGLTMALRFTKFKKPPTLPDPPEDLKASEVMHEWSETRNRMKELIERLPEDMIGREIFRHPYAGRMNFKQALTFMQEHFDHHEKQMQAIIKKSQ